MKSFKIYIGLFCLLVCNYAFAYKYSSPNHPVHVKSYGKKNGKYVSPHYRSKPNQHTKEYNREMKHAEA
jgi:hypothetical protein